MDKDEWNSYLRKRYAERVQWGIDFLGGKCAECGATENLEFDHRVRRSPYTSISTVIGRWSIARLIKLFSDEEIQLLCRPCHRLKSSKETSPRA